MRTIRGDYASIRSAINWAVSPFVLTLIHVRTAPFTNSTLPDVRNSRLWELFQSIRLIFGVREDTQPCRILCLKSPRNDQLKIAFTSTGLCTWSKESRTTDYNHRQNFSTSASGLVGKKGCGDHARRDDGKGWESKRWLRRANDGKKGCAEEKIWENRTSKTAERDSWNRGKRNIVGQRR